MSWEQDVNEPWVQGCNIIVIHAGEKRCEPSRKHDQRMSIHTRKATNGTLFTFCSHDKNLAQLSGRLIKYLGTQFYNAIMFVYKQQLSDTPVTNKGS